MSASGDKKTDKSLCLLKTIGIVLLVLFGAICIGIGIASFFCDVETELWLASIICSAILLLAIIICLTVITVMYLKNKTKAEELKSQNGTAKELSEAYQTIFGNKKCDQCDLKKTR